MKTACDTNHSGRTVWATILLSFWFLIVGVPAFCAAIPVDVLWAGMFDNSGQPLEGGKVYTYTAGTTASKATYIDSGKVTAAANPVVLDAYGRAQVYADGAYKFVIKNSDDVTLITIDNLEYVSSQNPSTLNTTTFSASSATIGSITALLGTLVNMTISSATITLANIVSPNISNASMTGNLYAVNIVGPATITGNINFASSTTVVATPTLATQMVNKGYVDNCPTPTNATSPANKAYVDVAVADAFAPTMYCPTISTFTASTYAAENIAVVSGIESLAQIPNSIYTYNKGVSSYTDYISGRIQFTATLAPDTIYAFFLFDDSGNIYDMVRTRLPSGIAGGCEVPINLSFSSSLASGSKSFSVYTSADKAHTFSIHHKGATLATSWQIMYWALDY